MGIRGWLSLAAELLLFLARSRMFLEDGKHLSSVHFIIRKWESKHCRFLILALAQLVDRKLSTIALRKILLLQERIEFLIKAIKQFSG